MPAMKIAGIIPYQQATSSTIASERVKFIFSELNFNADGIGKVFVNMPVKMIAGTSARKMTQSRRM